MKQRQNNSKSKEDETTMTQSMQLINRLNMLSDSHLGVLNALFLLPGIPKIPLTLVFSYWSLCYVALCFSIKKTSSLLFQPPPPPSPPFLCFQTSPLSISFLMLYFPFTSSPPSFVFRHPLFLSASSCSIFLSLPSPILHPFHYSSFSEDATTTMASWWRPLPCVSIITLKCKMITTKLEDKLGFIWFFKEAVFIYLCTMSHFVFIIIFMISHCLECS